MTRLLARLALLAALWPPSLLADGRGLYQGLQPFAAGDNATDTGRPVSLVACANCHGIGADGGSEASGGVPSLRWASLSRPSGAGPAYATDDAVLLAITSGVGRRGEALGPLMPRYRLTPGEARSLVAYLKVAGTVADNPPGVTAKDVRLGALLPLTGPLAHTGREILGGLSTVIDAANGQNGINGRRIRLVTADSAPGGASGARALLASDVYAVVGALWPQGGDAVEPLFAQRRVAMIANLSPAGHEPSGVAWSADLLAPLDVQADALMRALIDCPTTGARLIVSPHAKAQDVSQDVSVRHALTLADARRVFDAAQVTGCVGYEASNLQAMEQAVPPGWQHRVVLPFPSRLATLGPSPWHNLGEASARVALETLSSAGAALNERSLLDQLPRISGFEPFQGLAVRYSTHRRFAWNPEILNLGSADRFTAARE